MLPFLDYSILSLLCLMLHLEVIPRVPSFLCHIPRGTTVDMGLLRPSTLTLSITDFIIAVKILEVDLGLKIPATLSLAIVDFIILMLILEL